jgi:hypothetical protein
MAFNRLYSANICPKQGLKIPKTCRGILAVVFWPVNVAPSFWIILLRFLAQTWQHRRGPPCGFNPRFVLRQFFHRVRRGSDRVRHGSVRVRRGSESAAWLS